MLGTIFSTKSAKAWMAFVGALLSGLAVASIDQSLTLHEWISSISAAFVTFNLAWWTPRALDKGTNGM